MTTPTPKTEVLAPSSPVMALIDKALAGTIDVQILERLMKLHADWESGEARREYFAAMARAKAKFDRVVKTKKADAGRFGYHYDDLAEITEGVVPALSEYGLTHRFENREKPNDSRLWVACIVTHERGHSEEAELPGKPDTSGSKNDMQSLGSMVTYLERYTLKEVLGLAAAKDDDGIASGPPPSPLITEEQKDTLMSLMKVTNTSHDEVLRFMKVGKMADLTQEQYKDAMARLKTRATRQAEERRPKKSPLKADLEASIAAESPAEEPPQ